MRYLSTAALVGMLMSTTLAGAQAENFVIGVEQPAAHTWAMAATKFAEELSARTNGAVTAEVFTDAQLGSQRETLEGILTGTADGVVTLEPLSFWVPEIAMWGALCLFNDEQHLRDFVWGDLGREFDELAQVKGFRIIANLMRGPRQISSIRPINDVADMQDLKIRVPQSPTSVAGFQALGASPTPLAFSEVYQALDQKVIDAQENPLDIIYAARLQEVTPYIALSNHQRQVAIFVISEEKFQRLSDSEKEAVLAAGKAAETYHNETLYPAYMADIEEKLRAENVTFTQPDNAEFCTKVDSANIDIDPSVQSWIDRIRAMRTQ